MSRKYFAPATKQSELTISLKLAIQQGKNAGDPRPIPPSTSMDFIDLHMAAYGVLKGVAQLLALENGSGKKALTNLFTRTKPEPLEDGVLFRVQLPQKATGRKKPLATNRTLALLESNLTANALSVMDNSDPFKGSLLTINELLNKHGVDLGIRFDEISLELRDLGLADRTHAGEDWQGEITVLVTETHHLNRTYLAITSDKRKVQLILTSDRKIFRKIDGRGPICLRISGRGFQTKGLLRIVQIYSHKRIPLAAFTEDLFASRD